MIASPTKPKTVLEPAVHRRRLSARIENQRRQPSPTMSASPFGAGATSSPHVFALQHQRPKNSFVGCSRIGDYALKGKLGEGTFGEVHRAQSKKTGAVVALKKIIMHNEKDGVRRGDPDECPSTYEPRDC